MSSVEERLRRLEDLEQIRDVTARYADATNRGFGGRTIDWDALEQIYTDDAHWFSGFMGMDVTGRQALLDVLRTQEHAVDRALHSFTNPVIDLDGDTATGRWSMPIGSVHDGLDRAVFLSADFGYRRTETGWRIASVEVDYVTMLANPTPAGPPQTKEER